MDPRLAAAGPSVFPAIRETLRSIKILLNVSSADDSRTILQDAAAKIALPAENRCRLIIDDLPVASCGSRFLHGNAMRESPFGGVIVTDAPPVDSPDTRTVNYAEI
jgi:hypothetical protein